MTNYLSIRFMYTSLRRYWIMLYSMHLFVWSCTCIHASSNDTLSNSFGTPLVKCCKIFWERITLRKVREKCYGLLNLTETKNCCRCNLFTLKESKWEAILPTYRRRYYWVWYILKRETVFKIWYLKFNHFHYVTPKLRLMLKDQYYFSKWNTKGITVSAKLHLLFRTRIRAL